MCDTNFFERGIHMKKTLAIILALVLAAGWLGASAFADFHDPDGLPACQASGHYPRSTSTQTTQSSR